MNRNFKIVFTVSVALNILLAGFIAGSFSKRMDMPPPLSGRPEINQKIAGVMVRAHKEHKNIQSDLQKARRDLAAVLSAPEFREDDFQAVSERIKQAQQALFQARTDAMLDMAKGMTPEERKDMAAHMKSRSDRQGPYRGRHGDKPERPER